MRSSPRGEPADPLFAWSSGSGAGPRGGGTSRRPSRSLEWSRGSGRSAIWPSPRMDREPESSSSSSTLPLPSRSRSRLNKSFSAGRHTNPFSVTRRSGGRFRLSVSFCAHERAGQRVPASLDRSLRRAGSSQRSSPAVKRSSSRPRRTCRRFGPEAPLARRRTAGPGPAGAESHGACAASGLSDTKRKRLG